MCVFDVFKPTGRQADCASERQTPRDETETSDVLWSDEAREGRSERLFEMGEGSLSVDLRGEPVGDGMRRHRTVCDDHRGEPPAVEL